MGNNSVAIVGYGAVGKGMHKLFPEAAIHDPPLGIGSREEVNGRRFAFVAVPTPSLPDGSADVSIVREVIGWLESEVVILRSTVPVGTSEQLAAETGKQIVLSLIHI